MSNSYSRRHFIDRAVKLAGGSMLASMAGSRLLPAATAAGGYKALVCLYLGGGNDGFNWFVPLPTGANGYSSTGSTTGASGYEAYAKSRNVLSLPLTQTLSNSPGARNPPIPLAGLVKGSAGGTYAYGIHPSCPNLAALFNGTAAVGGTGKPLPCRASVVCNVGPLIQPTTTAEAMTLLAGGGVTGAVGGKTLPLSLPPQLFSHVDQTTAWMTSDPLSPNRYGWAGKMADVLSAQGGAAKLAFNINLGGPNYWQSGAEIGSPYVTSPTGPVQTNELYNPWYRGGARAQTLRQLIQQALPAGYSNPSSKNFKTGLGQDPSLMAQQYAKIWSNSDDLYELFSTALSRAPSSLASYFSGSGPGDGGLNQQLLEVARIISVQSQIGDGRQIFFVEMGGFDTHDTQLTTQQTLLSYVDSYVSNFMQALYSLDNTGNLLNSVTLFTMSDFGRSLTPNNDGTDHGWGNHHVVVGGAMNQANTGGRFYGQVPDLTINGTSDVGPAGQGNGRMVPTTSSDMYAATLVNWFGFGWADMAEVVSPLSTAVFPNLPNFSTAAKFGRGLGYG